MIEEMTVHKRRRKKKAGGSCEGERGHRRLDRPGRKRQMGGVSPPMAGGAPPQAMPPQGAQPQPSPQQIQQMRQMMAARQAQAAAAQRGAQQGMRPPGAKRGGGKWIQGAIKHPGALHRELGVPEGQKIPEAKIEKAAHSDNPTLAKRARLAETLKGFHHKKD